MRVPESEIRAGYDLGLEDLASGETLGGASRLMFLLPYSVAVVRNGGVLDRSLKCPQYDELSRSEKQATRISFKALTVGGEKINDYVGRNGHFGDYIFALHAHDRDIGHKVFHRDILELHDPSPMQKLLHVPVYPAVEIVKICGGIDFDRRPPQPEREYLDASKPGFIEALASLNEPELWHLIVNEFSYDLSCTYEVLDWIVDQPECDAATAALAFIRIWGEDYVGQPYPGATEARHNRSLSIAARICRRSEGAWFERTELSLDCVGERNDQGPLLERAIAKFAKRSAEGFEGRIPIPRRLLGHVFEGRPPSTTFFVLAECVVAPLDLD
jgi:hypothetical protein